jgi:hydrogenase-4 component F
MNDTGMLVALLLCPLVAGLASWLPLPRRYLFGLSLASQLAVLAVALVLIRRVLAVDSIAAVRGWLWLDPLSGLVMLVVALVTVAAGLYSVGYLGHEASERVVGRADLSRYFGLLNLFSFTMLLTTVAGNLGLLWTAVSATTLASAPLVDFYGSREPLEAAWKYLVLTVAGSLIALFGFLLLYQSAVGPLGGSHPFTVPAMATVATRLAAAPAAAAFLLILVGFGAKAGLAPMHTWLPDAHSQAPSPVCALLSGAELNCAMLAIFRVLALVTPAAGGLHLRGALLGFGLLSLLVGVLLLVSQRNFKRLLAYSSIEQMGMVATGVALGVPLAVVGGLLQMLSHGLAKALMFCASGNLLLRFRTTSVDEVSGAVRQMPATAVLLVAGALAIAGAPPFGLFVSELSIVSGAFRGGAWAVGALVSVLLVVAFWALVGPFHRMTFSAAGFPRDIGWAELNPLALLAPSLLLAAVLVLGVWVPSPLQDLIQGAVRVVSP